MGTFSDSKITFARKEYICTSDPAHKIAKGARYLRYAAGLKSRYPVCMDCALQRRYTSGAMFFDCAAVRDFTGQTTVQ